MPVDGDHYHNEHDQPFLEIAIQPVDALDDRDLVLFRSQIVGVRSPKKEAKKDQVSGITDVIDGIQKGDVRQLRDPILVSLLKKNKA